MPVDAGASDEQLQAVCTQIIENESGQEVLQSAVDLAAGLLPELPQDATAEQKAEREAVHSSLRSGMRTRLVQSTSGVARTLRASKRWQPYGR